MELFMQQGKVLYLLFFMTIKMAWKKLLLELSSPTFARNQPFMQYNLTKAYCPLKIRVNELVTVRRPFSIYLSLQFSFISILHPFQIKLQLHIYSSWHDLNSLFLALFRSQLLPMHWPTLLLLSLHRAIDSSSSVPNVLTPAPSLNITPNSRRR